MAISEAIRSIESAAAEGQPQTGFCSFVATAAQESPVGSARYFDRYLLVELAPPWPVHMMEGAWDMQSVPLALQIALQYAKTRGYELKPLGIAPDPAYSVPGKIRIMLFDKPLAPLAAYDRWEYLVPPDLAGPLVHAMFSPRPQELDRFAEYRQPNDGARDLLVCTHGAIDACCGKFGFPLQKALREAYVDRAPGQVRAWRVSSFGGHRFAPTLIDLPEGRYWGNLRPDNLEWLTEYSGSIAVLREHYRGWGALRNPIAQVAEAELFEREGWEWRTYSKLFETRSVKGDESRTEFRVAYESPNKEVRGAYDLTVEFREALPILVGCSGLRGAAKKYHVTSLTKTS